MEEIFPVTLNLMVFLFQLLLFFLFFFIYECKSDAYYLSHLARYRTRYYFRYTINVWFTYRSNLQSFPAYVE